MNTTSDITNPNIGADIIRLFNNPDYEGHILKRRSAIGQFVKNFNPIKLVCGEDGECELYFDLN